jgi:hypothetical protein
VTVLLLASTFLLTKGVIHGSSHTDRVNKPMRTALESRAVFLLQECCNDEGTSVREALTNAGAQSADDVIWLDEVHIHSAWIGHHCVTLK